MVVINGILNSGFYTDPELRIVAHRLNVNNLNIKFGTVFEKILMMFRIKSYNKAITSGL